jgi:hypothetical protein
MLGYFSDMRRVVLTDSDDDFKTGATLKDQEARFVVPMTKINQCGVVFEDTFTFTAKNSTFECSIGQAVALSPAVREQLSVDACARTFALENVTDVDSVERLFSCGAVSTVESYVGLWRQFGSPGLELEHVWSKTDPINLSSLDLSVFSVEALDEFVETGSFLIESEDSFLEQILRLGEEYLSLLRWIDPRFLSPTGKAELAENLAFPLECVWCGFVNHQIPQLEWDSVIVPKFPDIFPEFQRKQISLLWRGSRDGFGAPQFHSRCDAHANTLTVILDTNGNIFGGFTPVKWEPQVQNMDPRDVKNCSKSDPSLSSFIFTLKNPLNIPAQRFRLRPGEDALRAHPMRGPDFFDITIGDSCDRSTENSTLFFGFHYDNNTKRDGGRVFTDSNPFGVKEIEVFGITP